MKESIQKQRGRPRQYDPEQVLNSAMSVFWAKGYTGTSLDDLAQAMGMNRPSMYNAFGDKEALYRQALAQFAARLQFAVGQLFDAEPDLKKALQKFYSAALNEYFMETPPLGCIMFCTAPAEAIVHPEVRKDMKALLDEIDRVLDKKFQHAQQDGQYPPDADTKLAAKIAQAVLHSLALRSRAGEPRASLNKMVAQAVSLLTAAP